MTPEQQELLDALAGAGWLMEWTLIAACVACVVWPIGKFLWRELR